MSLSLTVANTNVTSYLSAFRINKDVGVEVTTLTLMDRSTPGANAYTTTLGDTFVLTTGNGTALLAGGEVVRRTIDHVIDGDGNASLTTTRVEAKGWEALPAQVMIPALTIPSQTVHETGTSLFATYLAPFGVSYTGPSSGGPTHPALTFEMQPLSAILDQVTQLTGCPWRVTGLLTGAFVIPGSVTGPTINGTAVLDGSVKIQQSRVKRATRLYGRLGLSNTATYTTSVVGNGTLTRFPLKVLPIANALPTHVVEGGTSHALGGGTWSYDATSVALVRASALSSNTTANCVYTVDGSTWIRTWDAGTQNSIGGFVASACIDATVDLPDQTEVAQGLAWLEAEQVRRVAQPRVLTLRARSTDYYPLLQVTIDLPVANVNGTFLVQAVDIEGKASQPEGITSTLTCIEGDLLDTDQWFKLFRSGGGSGGGGSVSVAGGSGGGSGTAAPVRIHLGGDNLSADNANTWTDIAGAVPTSLGGPLWTGTWTLRVPRYVRTTTSPATSIEVRLQDLTSNTTLATIAGTSSNTFTTATQSLSIPLTAGVCLLQYRMVRASGTPAEGTVGLCTLERD